MSGGWAVVWQRNRSTRLEVRSGLTEQRAAEEREWCNRLRYGMVAVVRDELLPVILRER